MDVLVSTIADCIFLQEDLQKWYKHCVKHARVRPIESASESRVLRVNETMLVDNLYNPALDDSDDEDLDLSIANNTTASVKRGLACGNIEEPGYNLKKLVHFAGQIKEYRRVVFQTSTTERLQRKTQSESQLKNKLITQKNVSFEVLGKGKSIQSTNKDTFVRNNSKNDHRSPTYNKLM